MIDFRDLRYFLVACEHENLGIAAKHIGIASSTLSTSLKSLEGALGVPLLRKLGSGISPLPSARWLYRATLPLMMIERFAVNAAKEQEDHSKSLLEIDIELNFAFGQITKAISRAAAAMAERRPLMIVHPNWTLEDGPEIASTPGEALGITNAERARISLDTTGRQEADEIELMVDDWVLVRRNPAQPDEDVLRSRPVALPDLPSPLIAQATAYLRKQGVSNVRQLKDHPCSMPELQHEHAGLTFMVPSSVLAARLNSMSITPLDPPLKSRIMGKAEANSEIASEFLTTLREQLNATTPPYVFQPTLTARRIRYFNLTHDLGRVSAAAHSASIAQPALSQQLHKLEATLGEPLFRRQSAGLTTTDAGRRFAPGAKTLERRLRELRLSGMSASLADGGRLSIGILPSVNQHGYLVNRITEAVLELRDRYPEMSLAVQEAPKAVLQDWIARGQVGMAVVESSLPQFPRFALDATEDLAVIADPRYNLVPPGPVKFRDLTQLPLALPTSQFGLRQLLDVAAKENGVNLKPKHEIDALTMLIGLLTREPICTIMPASAVRTEILNGELSAHPIVDPHIERSLFLVYSGDRSLTPAERELVTLLRGNLAAKLPTREVEDMPVQQIAG